MIEVLDKCTRYKLLKLKIIQIDFKNFSLNQLSKVESHISRVKEPIIGTTPRNG